MLAIVCFVVILTGGVATDVGIYVHSGNEYTPHRTFKPKPTSLYTINYHRGDFFSMEIFLRNEEPNVSADICLKYPSGQQKKFNEFYHLGEFQYYWLRLKLNYSNIGIDLELFTTAGSCITKRIAEGKDVSGSPTGTNDKPNDGICLKRQWCIIEVDLSNVKCVGPTIVIETDKRKINTNPKMKTTFARPVITYYKHFNINNVTSKVPTSPYKRIETTTNKVKTIRTSIPPPVTADKPQINETPTIKTTTAKPVADIENFNNNTNATNVSTSPHKNIETTTNKITTTDTNAYTTNNTVIIVSSISGLTFMLLLMIAIRKRCWIKRSPRGTPELPTIQENEPFYLNMLFRRECDQEIAEIDQHHYEEIIP